MGEMTTDKNELMRRWMKLYINLMILKSTLPSEQITLGIMKDELAECNGHMMRFFDDIGADPEAEG